MASPLSKHQSPVQQTPMTQDNLYNKPAHVPLNLELKKIASSSNEKRKMYIVMEDIKIIIRKKKDSLAH